MLVWGSFSGRKLGTVVKTPFSCCFLETIWHRSTFPGALFTGVRLSAEGGGLGAEEFHLMSANCKRPEELCL